MRTREVVAEQAHTLRSLLPAIVIGWAVFAVVSGVAGGRPKILALQIAMAALTGALWGLVHARPPSAPIVTHTVAAICAGGLVLNAWWAGGVASISYWYLAAIPLFAGHVSGRRAGLVWCVLSAGLVLPAVFPPEGVVAEFTPGPNQMALGAFILIAMTTAFSWLARRRDEQRRAALEALASEKSDMLATICHEVRTPLQGVLGTVAVLDETTLSPDQRELLGAVRASGASLRRIVDDALDVARLERGGLAIEAAEVDLFDVIEDVVDLYLAQTTERGVTLVPIVEGPAHLRVIADGARVRQILSNLVANAAKFTLEGSIVIRAEARLDGDAVDVRIAVEDTGPGLPPDRLDRLFVAFEQADASLARLHGGSGLGLALARDLAQRMGGDLTAERDRPVGASLVLRARFPAARASTTATPETRPSLLALETDPVAADALRSTAGALGDLDVRVVASLEQALASLTRTPAEVVVIGASADLDPNVARQALREVAGPETRLVLAAAPHDLRAAHASGSVHGFDATTMRPIRRSRLRTLLQEIRALGTRSHPPEARVGSALVVDDDPTNRAVLARLLENRGITATLAASGAEALRELEGRTFDVVLADLHMPEMDGTELVERAKPRCPETHFVAVSATVREEDRARCRGAGFDDFLTKPFTPLELDHALTRARLPLVQQDSAPSAAPPLLDARVLDELAELMGEDTDATLAELEASVRAYLAAAGDPDASVDDAERAAHTAASSTLTAGLIALGEAARALELEARTLDPATRAARARALAETAERSFEAVRAYRSADEVPLRAIRVSLRGHVDAATLSETFTRGARRARGAPVMLIDCREMLAYDPAARDAFVAWQSARIDALRAIAIVSDNPTWPRVVSDMATETGQAMQVFADPGDAEAWLRERVAATAEA